MHEYSQYIPQTPETAKKSSGSMMSSMAAVSCCTLWAHSLREESN